MKRRVGLLFGGKSVEHEVSLVSARGVASAMRRTDLECVPIGVTGDGRWLVPALSARVLDGPADRVEPAEGDDDGSRVVVDPGGGRLLELTGGDVRPVELDAVFPLVHGYGGEDGRFQGCLETADVPYVGAGVLGSAVAMDKVVTKELARARGVTVVPWLALRAREFQADRDGWCGRITDEIGYPAFVKPANGGSSVGVSRVTGVAGLERALNEAFACDGKVLVERGIDAREIECAVLGNLEPEASVLGEIVPSAEFYDYAAKYLDDASELIIPATLDPAATDALRAAALEAFRAAELSGFARIDFLVDRVSGTAYLNEINTLPGFTPISMFPKLWESSGLPYPRLIETLVELALERHERERGLRTRRADA